MLLRRCLFGATRGAADVEYGGLSCPLRVAVLSGSCPCGLLAVLLVSCVALGQPHISSSIAFCACTVLVLGMEECCASASTTDATVMVFFWVHIAPCRTDTEPATGSGYPHISTCFAFCVCTISCACYERVMSIRVYYRCQSYGFASGSILPQCRSDADHLAFSNSCYSRSSVLVPCGASAVRYWLCTTCWESQS